MGSPLGDSELSAIMGILMEGASSGEASAASGGSRGVISPTEAEPSVRVGYVGSAAPVAEAGKGMPHPSPAGAAPVEGMIAKKQLEEQYLCPITQVGLFVSMVW